MASSVSSTRDIEADVLVIGGGFAGVYAAVKAKELGAEKVVLVEKGRVGRTGMSIFGAGVVLVKLPGDDEERWLHEMVEHGEHVADQEWIQLMMARGYDKMKEVQSWGVEFKMDGNEFARTVGRGQREDLVQRNIMFNGIQMMDAMRKKMVTTGLKPIERVMVTDLLTTDGKVAGAVGVNYRTGEFYVFKANAVIVASGSNAYKGTFLGHRNVTGDSFAMMYRAGAEMISHEFARANTSARDFDVAGLNMLVGMGGKFINGKGESFIERYDPVYRDRASLPRLTAGMAMEVHEGRGPIYMDLRSFSEEKIALFRQTNPLALAVLEKAGIDMRVEPIPWMPALIGSGVGGGGGARINLECETTVPGLYATGDASWSAYQGAGSVGGPNFSYIPVTGEIAVRNAIKYHKEVASPRIDRDQVNELKRQAYEPLGKGAGMLPDDILLRFQEMFLKYDTWLLRRGDRLQKALTEVERIRDRELPMVRARDSHELRSANEIKNMITVAEMQLRSALARKESRGANVREDFPESDNINWLKWVVLRKQDEGMVAGTVPIPVDRYPIKPKLEKYLHPIFAGRDKYHSS